MKNKERTAYFILSNKLISADSYIPLGYLLRKLNIIKSANYISIFPELSNKININTLLKRMVRDSGVLTTPKKDNILSKLLLVILVFINVLFSHRPLLIYYLPYDFCSRHVFILYLIVKFKKGDAVIVHKRASVSFKFMESIRLNHYKVSHLPKKKLCHKLNTGKNNDNIFIFHDNDSEIQGLRKHYTNPCNNYTVLGLPYLNKTISDYVDIIFKNIKQKINLNDKYFLIILSKSEISEHMKSKNSFKDVLKELLQYLSHRYKGYTVVIKPHPNDYDQIESFIDLDLFTENLLITHDSPIIYAENARRIFTIGPTNVMSHLAKSRKIDVTDWSDEYKCADMNPYNGIFTIHVYINNLKKIEKLINDDKYFDKNVPTFLTEELTKESSLMNEKLLTFFN